MTFFLPCVTVANIAGAVGLDDWTYAVLSLLGPISLWARLSIRGRVREQRGIEGSCMGDCLVHAFCGCCALVQEAREIKEPPPDDMARQ